MNRIAPLLPPALTLARACAWALLVAGWIGIGSLAQPFAPTHAHAFGLVAMWLLALGAAAGAATHGGLRRGTRAAALGASAAITLLGLQWALHGGGLTALLATVAGWAALTALASGVVRGLRRAATAAPQPPIGAATAGALTAALVLGDPGDAPALALRLGSFVAATTLLLLALQWRIEQQTRAPGCRAGLFDCSLPAWPAGAWREPRQWPVLLAGLAMLPLMAALPPMAQWCSGSGLAPRDFVLLHLAAMFLPALWVRDAAAHWTAPTLSIVCTALLVAGAAAVAWLPAPWDMAAMAVVHGAAWGLAWSGQLWAPERRGRQGASPLAAAAGYAALTLAFGLLVDAAGMRAVSAVHAVLGAAAAAAWLVALAAPRRVHRAS